MLQLLIPHPDGAMLACSQAIEELGGQKQGAGVDLHGWDADGEVEGHEEVNPALPAPPQPGVDQAVPLCGLPKAGRPKNTHRAIH